MAGNRYDNGPGADPRGWTAPPGGHPQQQYGQTGGPEYFTAPQRPGPAAGTPGGSGASGNGAAGAAASGTDGYGPPQGPYDPRAPYTPAPGPPQGAFDPYASDQPGHTRAFPTGEGAPYGDGYPQQGYPQQGHGQDGYDPSGYGQDGYAPEYGQDNVAVYRAGGQSAPHVSGPRPRWRELLTGIYRSPSATFDRARDHQVWLPALTVSAVYGVLAVLGLGLTRDDVLDSTFTVALTALAAAAVVFSVAGAMLGAVTYGLARQFGGDGPWQSTVGLAVLIGWTTDAPRLLLALFLPADNVVVQAVGWATWVLCAVLLTTMVRRVHDLPWGKAAGAASLQLLALLVLIKLPTLG
ncbi:YIP1 family protein [Kitasatospora sp. NBC_00315]|uniref:Yip1 family protein n=1 Tax=Kitasatospora sp. NBC_00315 TaxID=2975963 RepID=UPI00324FC4EC